MIVSPSDYLIFIIELSFWVKGVGRFSGDVKVNRGRQIPGRNTR